MRNGPLVRRGANASRAKQINPSTLRSSATGRVLGRQSFHGPPNFPSAAPNLKTSCVHLECRLPINLREFLAEQLGAVINESDETVLSLAAEADEATLSKLARAIRRYSTNRARELWDECSVPLADLAPQRGKTPPSGMLCLKCVRLDFAPGAAERHQPPGCIVLGLPMAGTDGTAPTSASEAEIAKRVRVLIEEFRRLRAAFGLPHFELDSYVRNGNVTFTWRPVS